MNRFPPVYWDGFWNLFTIPAIRNWNCRGKGGIHAVKHSEVQDAKYVVLQSAAHQFVLRGQPSNFQVMYCMYYKKLHKSLALSYTTYCAAREPSCNRRCGLLPQKVGVHTVTQPVSQLYAACWQNGQCCVWNYLVSALIHRTVYWTEHTAAETRPVSTFKEKYQELPIDMNLKWLVSITGSYIAIAKAQKSENFVTHPSSSG